jgi:hypothetical protein
VFIPNISCIIRKKGRPDVYGQARPGPDQPERCSIVKMRYGSAHTTVRADSGASRAHADEFVSNNRILLASTTAAAVDDQLEVAGYKIRVKSLQPRVNVLGAIDHYEVEGEVWA